MNIGDKYIIDAFTKNFEGVKGKNIVIYGLGPKTEVILNNCPSDYNIIGLMDRYKTYGKMYGKKIISFEDFNTLKIDIIIVVSKMNNVKIIYDRIRDICYESGVKLYALNGKSLYELFGTERITLEGINYCTLNEDSLFEEINSHEAVSFDVFDTLVMRKTLFPRDVFDYIGIKAAENGIHIENFKLIRCMAEDENPIKHGNIYDIYDNLQRLTGITDSEREVLINLEVELEKKFTVPRKKIVEIFKHALKLQKKVYLISDMYLPKKVLEKILNNLGIEGYDDLLVSCDYKTNKETDLFKVYKEKVLASSYLHIGDNKNADGTSANNNGIDSYLIKSAYQMMQISSYAVMDKYIKTINERAILGLCIEKIFNNPFTLNNTYGKPNINSIADFGYTFIGAVITKYLLWLADELKNEKYDDVLFAARDGFLIQKLYNSLVKQLKLEGMPKGKYFYTSRKLCTLAAMDNEENIKWLAAYYDEYKPEEMVKKKFQLKEKEILPYDEKVYSSCEEYALAHKDKIFVKSKDVRDNYLKYMKKIGLEKGKKYAMFDLCAGGTVQYFLSKIVPFKLKGLYVGRYYHPRCNIFKNIDANSLFLNYGSYIYSSYFFGHYLFLETIITSFSPSIVSMDENGDPIYGKEVRSKHQLEFVKEMHRGIEEFFNDFIGRVYVKGESISNEFIDMLYNLMDEGYSKENYASSKFVELVDDMANRNMELDRNKWDGC